MQPHDAMKSAEANDAAWEASKGGMIGAAKWGAFSAILGGVGYGVSPVYRGLTIQFKVFLQMAGMALGGMIEADHRLREYEARVRVQRRLARDRAMWQSYERQFGKLEDEDKE